MALQFERQRERFESDPADRVAFELLEEHYFLHGAWGELTGLFERRLAAEPVRRDPAESARLLFRLGQVYEERCQNPDRAAECYRQAIQLDPSLRPPIRQLRRIHAARDQWEVALQLAELESRALMRPYERAEFLVQIGGLWETKVGDPEQAVAHYRRALEAVPEHADALAGLARGLEKLGRPDLAAAAWERTLAPLRGPERAPALVALARLREQEGDRDQAVSLHREALEQDPLHREALDALAEAASAGERWQELAELDERRFDLASGAIRRAAIALDAGRLHLDRLDDASGARRWFQRALELFPDDASVHLALAEVERRAGRPEARARHLEHALELAQGKAPAGLRLEAAQVRASGGDSQRALEHWRRANEEGSNDPRALEALAEALRSSGSHDELVEILERRVEQAADAQTRAALLSQLGDIQAEHLGDLPAARESYEGAFAADPGHPKLVGKLERVLRKLEDWPALRALLEGAQTTAPATERPALICSLGELALDQEADAAAATRAFEDALDLDPCCERALAGLRRVAEATGDDAALLRSYERQATATTDSARLARLATEIVRLRRARGELEAALPVVERWVELEPESRRALETQVELQETLGCTEQLVEALQRLDPLLEGADRISNRRRLGFLHGAEGREDDARAAWRAALEIDPYDLPALEALRDSLREAGEHAELADVLERLATLVPPTQREACASERAALLADRLGDLEGAIAALAAQGRDGSASPEVEEQLDGLLERAGHHGERVERLAARRARLDAGSAEARELDLRRAWLLLDVLARPTEAAELFAALQREDSSCPGLRDGLERALRASGDEEGLAALLEERARATSDPESRARVELERAILLEETLGRPEQARTIYAALAQGPPDSPLVHQGARRLERLLEHCGDHAALCEQLEQRILRVAPEERAALHARVGRIASDALGDRARALYHFEAAASLAPDRAETWSALAQLYESMNRPRDLLRATEGELATRPDSAHELALQARAGRLCARELGDAERAAGHYGRVLELDPVHPEATEFALSRLEVEQRFEQMAPLLEARLASLEEGAVGEDPHEAERRTTLRLRLAALRADHLDDLAGGVTLLESALEEMGPVSVVTEPLANLYQRAGRTRELASLCEEASRSCTAPLERAEWLLRLGEALRELGEDGRAADAYRGVLVERPDDLAARGALRELYRRIGETEALARLLQDELRRVAGPEEVSLRLELAELLEGPLGRPEEALVHLRRVLELAPETEGVLERALSNAEAQGRAEVALELIERALERDGTQLERAGLWARRGELLVGLDRPDQAVEAYGRALELDPGQAAVRRALRQSLLALERWPEALEYLSREAHEAAAEERAALLEQGAQLALRHVSDDAGLAWYEELRVLRPGDAEPLLRIAAIHERAGRPEAKLRALEEAAPRLPAGPRRRDLARERARVLERELNAPARAIVALEEARRTDPAHPGVLKDLDRLYEATDRPRALVEVLDARLALARGSERVALLERAAALRCDRLHDPERAAEALRTALDEPTLAAATRIELLRRLGDTLQAQGRPREWVEVAEQELAALTPGEPVFCERRAALRLALAKAQEQALGQPNKALAHLRALLDDEEGESAEPSGPHREEAEQTLLRLLRSERNDVELARRLAERLVLEPNDPEGWLELARLREERLWAPAAAADAYQEILREQPQCREALRGLRRCAERVGDWSEVARTLESELALDGPLPASERAALLRRLGRVCWERLGDTTRASRALAAALEAEPRDLVSLRTLQRLFLAMEDWRGALDLYTSELELLEEEDARRQQEVWLCIAELARNRLADPERAARAFASAALLGPLACRARLAWAELLRQLGNLERHADVLATWCDDPDAGASAADHVRLAQTFAEIGRGPDALRRLERAVEIDPECTVAWEGIAQAREAAGDPTGAAEAWERRATLGRGAEAAAGLVRAACLLEAADAGRAAELLRRATVEDPAAPQAHALLARLAERLERMEEAERSAARALELGTASEALPEDERVATALVGARAGARLERPEAVAHFAETALGLDPEHREALALRGEARFRLGEFGAARSDLEATLEGAASASGRCSRLAMLAMALETAGESEDALARYAEALEGDPGLDEAHAGRTRLLERLGRAEEAAQAWAAWAGGTGDARARAERLLRAGELERTRPEGAAAAVERLREAVAVDPSFSEGWRKLAEWLEVSNREAEALDAATRALASIDDDAARAALSGLRGRILERQGRARQAADAWREAAEADPRDAQAALGAARLLRGLGEWRAAAELLGRFAERHPGGAGPSGPSTVLLQLGRLRAGPLEDIEGAVEAYRKALAADPELREAREALAELLVHRPQLWNEAAARHLELLESDPTRATSLRALIRIARERGASDAEAGGLAILRALGVASLEERSGAPSRLPLRIARDASFADPSWEGLRRATQEASAVLAAALGASQQPPERSGQGTVARFRNAVLAAQGRLAAPALVPLPDREFGETLRLLARLALAPESVRGDGHLVNALASAFPRRSRKRVRRLLEAIPPGTIDAIDFAAWRAELRALATAVALDEGGGDLRSALLALLAEETAAEVSGLPPEADLTPWVRASPEALELLGRVVRTWSAGLAALRRGGTDRA